MTDTRSEYEKMLAGDTYLSPNPELRALQTEGRARLRKFNETPREDYPARMAALQELFGRPVDCWIETPLALSTTTWRGRGLTTNSPPPGYGGGAGIRTPDAADMSRVL